MCKDITALQAHIVKVIKVILEIHAITAKPFNNHSFFDCLKNLTVNKSVDLNVRMCFSALMSSLVRDRRQIILVTLNGFCPLSKPSTPLLLTENIKLLGTPTKIK